MHLGAFCRELLFIRSSKFNTETARWMDIYSRIKAYNEESLREITVMTV